MGKKIFFYRYLYRKGATFLSRSFTISYSVISIQQSIAEFSANPSSLLKQASEAHEPFVD